LVLVLRGDFVSEKRKEMKQLFGVICFVIAVVAVTGNAVLMLVSPRAWFKVPQWIRLSGSLAAERFSSGWGAIQVRILGACFLAVMAWFVHGCLAPRR
jgi:hypothetical protein